MPARVPPFAAQRIVFFALLFGMTGYAIAAAVALHLNEGVGLAEEPVPELESIAAWTGGALAVAAIATRVLFRIQARKVSGDARAGALFTGTLVPLALLEGGSLFATTVWMLNGNAVPCLAMSMALLALAIAIVPMKDPNAP